MATVRAVVLMLLMMATEFSPYAAKTLLRRSNVVCRMKNMQTCVGVPQYYTPGSAVYTLRKDGTIAYSSDFNITETMESISKVTALMTRCRDGESYNTCEYFNTWSFDTDVCGVITSRLNPWYKLHTYTQPPFKCPLKKGSYVVRNLTFNTDLFKILMGDDLVGPVWITKVRFFNEKKELHMCFICKVDCVQIRA